jgi:hypothetical protein
VAEQLKKEKDVEVVVVKGGLLELSVVVDSQKVVQTSRLWYPLPSTVIKKTHEFLSKDESESVGGS